MGKQCNHPGVNGVGFGELIMSPREVSNLPGVDDSDVELLLMKEIDELPFDPSGGFEADEPRWLFFPGEEELLESFFGVLDGLNAFDV